MNNVLAPLVLLVAGCAATHQPQYQVGDAGAKQSRAEAERTYAEAVAKTQTSGYDSPAQVLSSYFPDYPQSWRNANIVGSVVVQFTVQTDGTVSNPTVVGSPRPELAALVLHAIMRWKFKPAVKNGTPVSVRAQQQFDFSVE